MPLRDRLVRGLTEQARMASQLSGVAEAMAAEVNRILTETAEKTEAIVQETKEARMFRDRFTFEAEQHFKAHDTMTRDDLVRLLERTGDEIAANT